jgi:cytochrome c oxidase subunit 2
MATSRSPESRRDGGDNRDAGEPRHGRRIALIWLALSLVATPIVVFVWGPHLPPGNGSVQAADQRLINTILAGLVTPIALGVVVYALYALIVFRDRDGRGGDGPPIAGDRRIATAWMAVTFGVVVFAVSYGTWDWMGPGFGSGSGQGPEPISRPPGETLEVQVIAQQWQFTYRYPTYGGIETQELVVPVDRYIEFHVTSLDVIHSFWAIELGVKADAVPGADNVAFVDPQGTGPVTIRCAELCGLWHGQMYQQTARVETRDRFESWMADQQRRYDGILPHLPPYAHVYYPPPDYRAG